jgi:hypothetical protein
VNDWVEGLAMVVEMKEYKKYKLFKIAKLNLCGKAKYWF